MRRWRFLNKRETIVLSRPDDGSEGELHRWRLIETPLGGIMLHCHHGPDPGRVLHDHPWPFASLILRGGYVEEVADARDAPALAQMAENHPAPGRYYGSRHWRRRGSLHAIPITAAHRIVMLLHNPTWTLVLHGRRRRGWGFYRSGGFIDERLVDWKRIDLIGAASGPVPGEPPQ